MITKYNKDATIAKTLKTCTSMLTVAVLKSSITDESNNPYTNTKANTKVCANKYIINPNKIE